MHDVDVGEEQLQHNGIRYSVVLVEDEPKIAHAVEQGLAAEGFQVFLCTTGEEALDRLQGPVADIVVLDVMLPGADGFTIVRRLRSQGLRIPVLLLTSRDAVEDRVVGLNAGADDYLVKPFAFSELLARVRALCRRFAPELPQFFQLSDLRLSVVENEAQRSGQKLELTRREFQLLHYLLVNQDKVVSREMLARDVWLETDRYTPLDNVIDVQMARLRRKLDDAFPRKLLHTVRGIGFVLREKD